MIRHKMFILVVLLFSLIVLAGCRKDQFQIGILIYDENDTFMKELVDIVVSELPDNVNYKIVYASRSQFNQNQQLLDFLKDNVDLLIINLVDRLAASSIVEKCAIEEVPIIFINREPIERAFNQYENAYYVGADPEQQGIEQALIAAKIFGDPSHLNPTFDKNGDGNIQFIILKGEQAHQDAEKRTLKLIETLQNLNYNIDLLETRVANWKRETAKEMMVDIYRQYGDHIEVIFANNDDMALGAIDYFLEHNYFVSRLNEDFYQPVVVIGVDGTQSGIDAINNGLLAGTVQNDALNQSNAILEMIHYFMSEESDRNLSLPLTNNHYYFVPGDRILHPSFMK